MRAIQNMSFLASVLYKQTKNHYEYHYHLTSNEATEDLFLPIDSCCMELCDVLHAWCAACKGPPRTLRLRKVRRQVGKEIMSQVTM